MKAKLILWLLQQLTSHRGRSALVAALILLLVPLVIITSVVPITVPLVTDDQMDLYREHAENGLPPGVEVDWRHMVAIDAVRNRQDFSGVNAESIKESGELFTHCELETHMETKPITVELQEVGDLYSWTFTLDQESEVWWQTEAEQGAASVDMTGGGKPVSSGKLEPGTYTLFIEATEAPALIHVDLYVVTEVQVCTAKPPDQVMAELGFTPDERELAQVFMNTLADVA